MYVTYFLVAVMFFIFGYFFGVQRNFNLLGKQVDITWSWQKLYYDLVNSEQRPKDGDRKIFLETEPVKPEGEV